jgi:O-methyltransferase involved in polyketide biosynthesis
MKGNSHIGITAEIVALMREERGEKLSSFFISEKARRITRIVKFLAPGVVKRIFEKRLQLSDSIEKMIEDYNPQQVIELGAGVSTQGLIYLQNHPQCIWIDSDLEGVVNEKERAIKKATKDRVLNISSNYHLVSIDVLSEDIIKSVGSYLKKGRRTLIVAQGLTTYFNSGSYENYLEQVIKLSKKYHASYISHEPLKGNNGGITSGIGGKLLRGLVSLITKNRAYCHYTSKDELFNDFENRGLKVTKSREICGNLIFRAE